MNKVALSGSIRNEIGSKYAAQLRREKRVPCVLYGGDKTVHFSVDESALNKLVFTPELNGIDLDLDGTKTLALVKEKQFHPLTDRVIHVDFMEVNEAKETSAVLSVRLNGQPVGVRNGGTLSQTMRKLRVKGLPSKLPQRVDIDVSGLDVNQTIHVEDLKLDGITMLERGRDVVAAVKVAKKAAETVEAAATPATPAAADAKKAEAKPAAKK